jgi:hypothetical protein
MQGSVQTGKTAWPKTGILGRAKIFFQALLSIWFLLSFAAFVATGLVRDWPAYLPLPWSDLRDFAVSGDGKAYAFSAMFDRILVHDLQGAFLYSLPAPGKWKGIRELAITKDNGLFIRQGNTVCKVVGTDAKLECKRALRDQPTTWRLDVEGEAQPELQTSSESRLHRPAKAGEILFVNDQQDRVEFVNATGARFWREGASVYLEGQNRRIGTRWYLIWAQFPWPGMIPIVLGLLIGTLGRLLSSKRVSWAPKPS